jgi:hypothetical protein
MEPPLVNAADIHARAAPHGLKLAQYLNILCCI